ncbi:MAG: hypothetical protein M3N52_11390, partial [Actinomycetota bacterium]|nr:hypothetical protein [Actinomycetota bacterium]
MPPSLASLAVLATESGLPPSDLRTQLAVPLGILVFIGSIYVLLRANLGTRRGYLVLGCSLFGFLSILALFWTFGAPGTPPATGPQSLPGQELNAYEPTWVAFAGDSLIAEKPEYAIVRQYPEGFGPVPEGFAGTAGAGAEDIKSFFSSRERQTKIVQADWVPVPGPEGLRYAEAANGRPIIAVTFAPPEGAEDADATPVTVFGYYDAGNPMFPG